VGRAFNSALAAPAGERGPLYHGGRTHMSCECDCPPRPIPGLCLAREAQTGSGQGLFIFQPVLVAAPEFEVVERGDCCTA
jgi:hypothetical protein